MNGARPSSLRRSVPGVSRRSRARAEPRVSDRPAFLKTGKHQHNAHCPIKLINEDSLQMLSKFTLTYNTKALVLSIFLSHYGPGYIGASLCRDPLRRGRCWACPVVRGTINDNTANAANHNTTNHNTNNHTNRVCLPGAVGERSLRLSWPAAKRPFSEALRREILAIDLDGVDALLKKPLP